jgi:hypothetical protein
MRRLERSLHQHIFKVGWLLTKKLQTTTILYYLIFLPGVFLHEFIVWLVAGIMDVRAERAIAWPETQAVAELRLTFVKLSKNAGSLRTALISVSPLIFGILFIGFVANNVLNVNGFVQALGGDVLENLGTALGVLTATPDFWLWVYLIFTVGNTMWPDIKALRGWRPILTGIIIAVIVLYLAGLGDAIIGRGLMVPVVQGINVLSGTLVVITAVDLFFTAFLGAIESIIERVTGDSATFQSGKLVAMRREEVLRLRQQQREREAKQAAAAKVQRAAGPPSIYSFPLPIPGSPGKESQPIVVTKEEQVTLPAGETGRAGPALITGTAVVKPEPKPEEPPSSEKATDEEEVKPNEPEEVDEEQEVDERETEDHAEVDERS